MGCVSIELLLGRRSHWLPFAKLVDTPAVIAPAPPVGQPLEGAPRPRRQSMLVPTMPP